MINSCMYVCSLHSCLVSVFQELHTHTHICIYIYIYIYIYSHISNFISKLRETISL